MIGRRSEPAASNHRTGTPRIGMRGPCLAMLWLLTLASAGESEPEDIAPPGLIYVKESTLRETRDASLRATGVPVLGPWSSIGPFDNGDGRAFERAFPPEREGFQPEKEYEGRGGAKLRWTSGETFEDGKVHDLLALDGKDRGVAYLHREVRADKRMAVELALGSDDALRLWVNGESVLSRDVRRGVAAGDDRVVVTLERGVNEILLKVVDYGGAWEFIFESRVPEAITEELEARLARDFPRSLEEFYYTLASVPAPPECVLEVGGMDFRPDGDLAVATRRGEIWLIDDPGSGDLETMRYRRYAEGLDEPLGLRAMEDGSLLVMQRAELTRIRDGDGDGIGDDFETVCAAWGVSGDYHEYAYGPVIGDDGWIYGALNLALDGGPSSDVPYRGWAFRTSPEGVFEPLAYGLRSPNGIGKDLEGNIFLCDNQGEWIPACHLSELVPGRFYGHPVSRRWKADPEREDPRAFPAVLFPYPAMSQSASEPVCDTTGGRFGPFAGQMLVGDQTRALILRVALEEVRGEHQGACFFFRSGFSCGINRLAFAPDGSLFAGLTRRGWGSAGDRAYGIDHLRWTGEVPFEVLTMSVTADGFDLVFTKDVDPGSAGDPRSYSLEEYGYRYWSRYGSPEVDRRPVPIERAAVSADRRRVSLVTGDRRLQRVFELDAHGVRSSDLEALLHPQAWYTLRSLP